MGEGWFEFLVRRRWGLRKRRLDSFLGLLLDGIIADRLGNVNDRTV